MGPVDVPELGLDEPHPLIVDFYESLKHSAQSQFYEPSDWQFARFTLHFADQDDRRPGPRGDPPRIRRTGPRGVRMAADDLARERGNGG
ncbi:hypothetical protein ALI144C_07155 [Actinosynnema sp. ALI-1.44]|nr:hypothetical protein ALI144C_07155 [Actinosynnema sp. ALI-1.44]